MEQIYFNYNIKPGLSLDDFFVGKSNVNAFDILLKNKSVEKNFFLLGPNKSGKTHLGSIWADHFKAINFNNNLDQILKNKKNVFIDDIFNHLNEESIFHIINHCNSYNLKILVTSNLSLNDYNFILRDVSSRLKTFSSITIDLPDDELLVNLMTKLLHDKQIIIKNPEIFQFIIKRVDRSYEKIFILINKIDKLLLKKNKQLTIPLIKELI